MASNHVISKIPEIAVITKTSISIKKISPQAKNIRPLLIATQRVADHGHFEGLKTQLVARMLVDPQGGLHIANFAAHRVRKPGIEALNRLNAACPGSNRSQP